MNLPNPWSSLGRPGETVLSTWHILAGAGLITILVALVGANIVLSPGTIMYGDFNTPREIDRFELYPMWTEFGHYSNLDKVDRLLGLGRPHRPGRTLAGIQTETFIKMMLLGVLLIAGLASYCGYILDGEQGLPRYRNPRPGNCRGVRLRGVHVQSMVHEPYPSITSYGPATLWPPSSW